MEEHQFIASKGLAKKYMLASIHSFSGFFLYGLWYITRSYPKFVENRYGIALKKLTLGDIREEIGDRLIGLAARMARTAQDDNLSTYVMAKESHFVQPFKEELSYLFGLSEKREEALLQNLHDEFETYLDAIPQNNHSWGVIRRDGETIRIEGIPPREEMERYYRGMMRFPSG